MEKAIASTADEVKAVQSRDDRIVSSNNIHEAGREKVQHSLNFLNESLDNLEF